MSYSTFWYTFYFSLIWSSAVLAIPLAIGMATWLFLPSSELWSPPANATAGQLAVHVVSMWQIYATVALVLWTTLLRLHSPRVLIRSGAWPALCTNDLTPKGHDVDALVATLADAVRKNEGRSLAVVGSGWGYFLYRKGPPGPRLFLHRFTGLIEDNAKTGYQLWAAGTTIATIARALRKDKLTVPSHPTLDYISVGAWFVCGNHGNGGDANSGSKALFGYALVYDMQGIGPPQKVDSYQKLREIFDNNKDDKDPVNPDYVVLAVAINRGATIRNGDLQKRGLKVNSTAAAADWLAPGAVLRVLFVGSARDYGIGLRWEKVYDRTSHRDPHFGSRFCQFLQVDVCSVIGGCHETLRTYDADGKPTVRPDPWGGITTHYHANRWMPTVFPVQTLAVVLTGHVNFEVIFRLPQGVLDGTTLWVLVDQLRKMHAEIGGRSEVRYGKLENAEPIFLDVSLRHSFRKVFEILRTALRVERVTLHIGKRFVDTQPCRWVTNAQFFYGSV